jgi:hypothetical protein
LCNDDFCRNFGNDFISKQKVREKIEELEISKAIEDDFELEGVLEHEIELLNELLEKEN